MKFRISTILWLTLAVACFFAGMHWDDFYAEMRTARANTAAVQVGKSINLTVPSKGQIQRAFVRDPNLVSAIAVAPKSIRLTGQRVGTTTVTLWDAKGVQTAYSVTVKANQVENFSFFVGLQR